LNEREVLDLRRGSFALIIAILASLIFPGLQAKGEPLRADIKAPNVDARCAIAMDSKTKIVLFEKNSHTLVPMASTTKIITALVALKYGNPDKEVEISQRASSIRGSTVGYRKGQKVTIRELTYGLMLRSGNDAAIAIAEGIAGSVEEFLKIMNEFACEIGLVDTHFETPHGLDKENHYTTAYDLALVTAKAKEVKEFNRIVSAKDVDGGSMGFTRSYHNINKILWQIPSANGVKTGFTGQAGKCLVSSITHQGNDIIIVVLNSTPRWRETKRIYDYVSMKYEYKQIAVKDEIVEKIPVTKAVGEAQLKSSCDVFVPVKKYSEISKEIVLPSLLSAPVKKGDKLGRLNIYEDKNLIYSMPLECDNNVQKRPGIADLLRLKKNP
jgi:serine-type D-Ala-D-Ala carboxypeptidase (penicillin-binding protein 5/6)